MAVSVKDFLDAIRGRFNDEPNKVEVTGRILKHNTTNINENIASGETITLFSNKNLNNGLTDKIRLLFRFETTDPSNVEVTIRYARVTDDYGSSSRLTDEVLTVDNGKLVMTESFQFVMSEKAFSKEVMGNFVRITLRNSGTQQHLLRSVNLVEVQPKGVS